MQFELKRDFSANVDVTKLQSNDPALGEKETAPLANTLNFQLDAQNLLKKASFRDRKSVV